MGRAGSGTTLTLLLASNAPDIDIVTTAGGALSYLEWHRGPTHGPLGVLALGVVAASIAWCGTRLWRAASTDRSAEPPADPPASFPALWAVATVGVMCHILMDLPTSYGTRPLSPFDWRWFAHDWMPIVDIYLLIALAAGLLIGRRSMAAGRRLAALALLFMALNYGVRATAHHQAVAHGPRLFGPLLPERCDDAAERSRGWIDRWPLHRDALAAPVPDDERERSAKRCLAEIAAIPDFVSPFRWRVIADLSNAYEMRTINLLALPDPSEADWRLAVRHPNQWTPAVAAAAQTRVGTVFLGFSRFPSVRSVVGGSGDATVVWNDIRFAIGRVTDSRRERPNFFTATVRLDRDGGVVEEKLGP